MKALLISAALATFIFATAFREVSAKPVVTEEKDNVTVENRAARMISAEGSVPCMTTYFTTIHGDGRRTTRRSVDCVE